MKIIMLTENQYNQLLPFKEDILSKDNRKASKYLILADKIRQKMGLKPICFNCDGSKIEAINDIYNLFKEYEKNNGIITL